jgi:hypothetical protein
MFEKNWDYKLNRKSDLWIKYGLQSVKLIVYNMPGIPGTARYVISFIVDSAKEIFDWKFKDTEGNIYR